MTDGVSRMFATSTNGFLNRVGGYGLAFFVAICVAGLAAVVLVPVREVARPPKRPSLSAIGRLISRRDVLLPALLNAVGQYIVWSTTFGFLPILARRMGATGELQSLLVALNLAIGLGGNLLTTTIARRVGNVRLLYASFVILAAGIAALASAQTLAVVILAQVLIGLGGGINFPLCMGMSIEKVDDGQRATAMGLHQAVYGSGMFAGPWMSGILANALGIQPMFWVTGTVCLAVSLSLATVLGKRSSLID
jgi:MFS family permease